ncbi:hypothetical protein EII29_03530 [Leptotrichia sp. OH3620_COT-345]|uniref:hypothetical protein n=1 Tax=Leptotrichia sp. OH3620_COT-345 TaxID=2491048 RepID=UPI000F655D21|nr:hypothetical protein [Leptotrichia sp. OH3620_COT-345]RRD40183.1 hypothetical protein EII29_03530 [Leptotrichia sp. OH3620_COT-345]
MLSIGYNEIDILWEITNFKIVNKEMIMSSYNLTKSGLSDVIKKINDILDWEGLNPLIDKKGYIFFNNDLSKKNFQIGEAVKFKNSIRKEIIYLFLLLSNRHFNMTKFTLRFQLKESSKKYVRIDLKSVLEELSIDYSEYRETKNPLEIIRRKIKNFELLRRKYLKNILIKRFEKAYFYEYMKYEEMDEHNIYETNPEKIMSEIIKEELKIKDIRFIFKKLQTFFRKYGKLFTINEKYDFFVYFILNLNNKKENMKKRITSKSVKLKESSDYKLLSETLDEISKNENVRIYSYFRLKLYKFLLKKEKENFNVKVNELKEKSYDEVVTGNNLTEEYVYQIAEETEKSREYKNSEKPKTLLVLDVEYSKMVKYERNIKDILKLVNIIEYSNVENLSEKINNDETKNYEQIFIISSGEIQNLIKNYSKIPIYFFRFNDEDKSGKKKGKLKRRVDFERQLSEVREMMTEYRNMKK